jgi:hypothetical protein
MATIDEYIEFALKNIGLWWRYGISQHCDKWKYIIIGRIFESEIILIPPSLKISECSSNGSYRNTDEVWWRYGISQSCDKCCDRSVVFSGHSGFLHLNITEILLNTINSRGASEATFFNEWFFSPKSMDKKCCKIRLF